MTSAAFVKNDTEPGTTGSQPAAALPPRVQECADILAEARARRIRSDSPPQSESA